MPNIEIPSNLHNKLCELGLNVTDVVLYLGSKCNLRCSHCYIGNDLLSRGSFYSYQSIVNFLSNIEVLERITVLGGEPLLYPEFNHLVSFLSKFRNTEKRITTNATITNNINWDDIKKAGIRVCASLDGHTPDLHDSVRGRKTFNKAINTIRMLVSNGHDVEVTHTVNSDNIDYIDEFICLCKQLEVKRINLHRATPRGNAISNGHLVVGATRWRLLVEHLREMGYKQKNGTTSIRYELAFATDDEYQELVDKGLYAIHSSVSFYSKVGGNRVVIYPDGKLYISSEAFGTESYIGTICNDDLQINDSRNSELHLSNDDSKYITNMNSNMVGDKNFPVVLCVSYRESHII